MVIVEKIECDICRKDGDETEAIGWYQAKDGNCYDVCKKHAEDVRKAKLELRLYLEGR